MPRKIAGDPNCGFVPAGKLYNIEADFHSWQERQGSVIKYNASSTDIAKKIKSCE